MREPSELGSILERIDGRGYGAYKDIRGAWRFSDFVLHVDHVQGDPFAAPSRVRAVLRPEVAGLPEHARTPRSRALGTAALLARTFARRARDESPRRGGGHGRAIHMEAPAQQVLDQTAVLVATDGAVEARFTVALPARGRRILGREAAGLLLERVPEVVRTSLTAAAHRPDDLRLHADTNEDAEHLRGLLEPMGLVAFVADGSILPRRSGVDDRPLQAPEVVPFRAPERLRVEVTLPNAGRVAGMGVPRGVTLIVGGGFHGKSTLLHALETGVYNHRPGDGRERAVTVSHAVKVRAEDGRSVAGVDISPFIDGLPLGRDTRAFSTPNASGSTSQAAAIVEAIEVGARVLLVDEDTSATNFMIRDRRMQALVPKAGEPITPFVDRVRALYEHGDVSSVLVLGGSGDYLDVADTVLCMRDYVPHDVTDEAHTVAARHPTGRVPESPGPWRPAEPRRPDPRSVDPRRGRRDVYVKVPDERTLLLGESTVDLAALEQIVCRGQVRALGLAMARLRSYGLDGRTPLSRVLDLLEAALDHDGLDAIQAHPAGDLSRFRRFELAAALNRLRSLRVGP